MISDILPRRTRGLAVVVLLTWGGSVRAADDSIERALQAAFRPPAIAGLNLFTPTFEIAGHRFGVPPVTVVETGDKAYLLSGTLTCQPGAGLPAETLAFRITKRRGGAPVVRAECRLGGGPWLPLATPLSQSLTGFRTGRALTPAQQQEQRRHFDAATAQALDGSWRRAAEFLIARIALGDGC